MRDVLTSLVLAGLIIAAPSLALGDWEQLTTEEGIEVSQREIPDRALPVFRAVGVIDASVYEVFAVIADVDNQTHWMESCVEARRLKRESQSVSYAYNRTDAPWPVSDRDVVVRAEMIIVEPGKEVHQRFKSVASDLMGPVRGVVRMPRLEGHYKLRVLGPDRTRVEYQVDADPGGRLPKWLVKRTSRDLPLHTLLNLRRRVAETKGSYEEFLDRWDPARR
jgi:hypothetical protein